MSVAERKYLNKKQPKGKKVCLFYSSGFQSIPAGESQWQESEVAPRPATAKNKESVLTGFPTSGQVDFSTPTVQDTPCPHAENLGPVWTAWDPSWSVVINTG